jgi:hypothetical protein
MNVLSWSIGKQTKIAVIVPPRTIPRDGKSINDSISETLLLIIDMQIATKHRIRPSIVPKSINTSL